MNIELQSNFDASSNGRAKNPEPSIRIDILVRAVVGVSVAVEAATSIRIGRHRINAQEASARRDFVVSERIFPSPFKDLAQVFAGELCIKSEFFPRRDFGSRTRARCDVSIGCCGSFGLDLRNWKSPNPQFSRRPTE